MHASTSTSTFRPAHRRQRSANRPSAASLWESESRQHANNAARPFPFVPRRDSARSCADAEVSNVQPPTSFLYEAAPPTATKSSTTRLTPPTRSRAVARPTESPLTEGTKPPRPFLLIPSPDASLSSPEIDIPVKVTLRSEVSAPAPDLRGSRPFLAVPASPDTDVPAKIMSFDTFPRVKAELAHPPLLRKKSGELLKPSLRARTKSAPSTPGAGSKAVRFDQELEHVRLFRARQTPRAVSRDGSPTETSEGESDAGTALRLLPSTLPATPAEPWTFDVRLERLAPDPVRPGLVGSVLVRNIAFAKRVAARFTLDAWQTTSEVAAQHVATLRGGAFDRFEFRVRLADFRGGRLLLCVRYAVDGREMWDNNGARNYEVAFERVRGGSSARDGMADLRMRLERAARAAPDPDTDDDAPPPPLQDALRARYDFAASVRRPAWTPPPLRPPGLPPRAADDSHVLARRHVRGRACFDAAPAVRRTPAGAADEDSTPSATSASASSSANVSPQSPTAVLPLPSPSMPYHSFLDQFCFFTSPDPESPRRTHSASSVEDYFSTSPRQLAAR